jgi:hypothetical protein
MTGPAGIREHPRGSGLAPDDEKAADGAKTDVVRFDDALLDEVLRGDPNALDSEAGADSQGSEVGAEKAQAKPRRRLSRAVLGASLAALALLVVVLALNWNARRGALDDLSAAPFAIKSTLAIAANAAENDRSVLWLVCTSENQVVLALKTRLAVGREFYATGEAKDAALYVDGLSNRIETRMRLVKRARYDLLVSSKLSGTALSAISSFFGVSAPPTVSVVALETDTKLTGQVAKGQISGFASACR